MNIAVIIPTYNEAKNLPRLVASLLSLSLHLNLIIVDDDSPDGTGDLAEEMAQKNPKKMRIMHRAGKFGLRSAYLEGIKIALEGKAQAVAQMDADFSHDPQVLVTMAERLEMCDVVFGSRYIPGGQVDADWSLWRKMLSAWGNYYARTILHLPLRDVTTGYRLWRRETLEGMPLERIQAGGYIFLVEMAYIAYCLEYHFSEAPIYFAERRWGKSKMNFSIQAEAAFRVWNLLWSYRDLKRKGCSARLKN